MSGWTPTAAAARAAREALDVRASLPRSQRAGTLTGIARAHQLAARRHVSDDTVRRMVAFFARNARFADAVPPSKSWQAWNLWGGDAARKDLEHHRMACCNPRPDDRHAAAAHAALARLRMNPLTRESAEMALRRAYDEAVGQARVARFKLDKAATAAAVEDAARYAAALKHYNLEVSVPYQLVEDFAPPPSARQPDLFGLAAGPASMPKPRAPRAEQFDLFRTNPADPDEIAAAIDNTRAMIRGINDQIGALQERISLAKRRRARDTVRELAAQMETLVEARNRAAAQVEQLLADYKAHAPPSHRRSVSPDRLSITAPTPAVSLAPPTLPQSIADPNERDPSKLAAARDKAIRAAKRYRREAETAYRTYDSPRYAAARADAEAYEAEARSLEERMTAATRSNPDDFDDFGEAYAYNAQADDVLEGLSEAELRDELREARAAAAKWTHLARKADPDDDYPAGMVAHYRQLADAIEYRLRPQTRSNPAGLMSMEIDNKNDIVTTIEGANGFPSLLRLGGNMKPAEMRERIERLFERTGDGTGPRAAVRAALELAMHHPGHGPVRLDTRGPTPILKWKPDELMPRRNPDHDAAATRANPVDLELARAYGEAAKKLDKARPSQRQRTPRATAGYFREVMQRLTTASPQDVIILSMPTGVVAIETMPYAGDDRELRALAQRLQGATPNTYAHDSAGRRVQLASAGPAAVLKVWAQ